MSGAHERGGRSDWCKDEKLSIFNAPSHPREKPSGESVEPRGIST